ncbi:hypothetical protein ElyMa_006531100 [Elysia marginata]|uniref:Uncharacterized protein n=1 Tax=Elysia marginata TaxID=1093978 RepID=A0AAV4I7K1_9GAST|nr:hypothetical protein ElyMa_006531100 [Elysia marginata]
MISGAPAKFTMEGTTIKVKDVLLAQSSCTKPEVTPGNSCQVAANSQPKYQCSADLYWDQNGLRFANLQMGSYTAN